MSTERSSPRKTGTKPKTPQIAQGTDSFEALLAWLPLVGLLALLSFASRQELLPVPAAQKSKTFREFMAERAGDGSNERIMRSGERFLKRIRART